jgi:hypothetical protein
MGGTSPCSSILTLKRKKKVNIYNTYHPDMTESECATKRIPVCPSTWESIHQLRMPGQTYDDVIRELIRTNSETKLIEETERICKRGHFVEYKL